MLMFSNNQNNTGLIVGLIVGGSVVLLVIIFVILYFTVFKKTKIKKEIRNLESRFQYLHALLIGQDAQYVKRLEIISRTNLLYVDVHTRFLKKFKEIRDKYDSKAQSTINNLKDLLSAKKYKVLNEALPDSKDIIKVFEDKVNELNNELLKVVKPEEDCRQASLSLKENYRRIKQEYYAKQSDLQLMSDSFEEIFKYVDSLFEQFENFVESAQYDDANTILPKIQKILIEVSNAMGELPNLCASVISVVPDKISSLENAYELMQQENYPLHHLGVSRTIKDMRDELNELTIRIRQFDITGVSGRIDFILSRIDEFFVSFDEEKKAKEKFDVENDSIYSNVNTIERRFIKLCNTIPEVGKVYIINDEHQAKITSINNDINKLGALKRSLDTLIHSSTKQPYTLLIEKMDELKDASESVITEMDDFSNYISSLRTDSENAYHLIYDYFFKIKENEKIVKDINVEKISQKYQSKFDRLYTLLNSIYNLLLVTPIDVDKINNYVNEVHDINNQIFDKGAIYQDYNMMIAATNAIIYANRKRQHTTEISSLIDQAEELFNDGEFEQSYIIAGNALSKSSETDDAKK
ncbi:MAG TPA: hypothetical protein DDW20_06340 [Firmicutes bacterium]|nr:hypothetical protein [Bacillota bacterium]